MKIVSISDYAIHHRIGRGEPTGATYTTRFGNTRQKTVFKEFYKTSIGEILELIDIGKQIYKTVQKEDNSIVM